VSEYHPDTRCKDDYKKDGDSDLLKNGIQHFGVHQFLKSKINKRIINSRGEADAGEIGQADDN